MLNISWHKFFSLQNSKPIITDKNNAVCGRRVQMIEMLVLWSDVVVIGSHNGGRGNGDCHSVARNRRCLNKAGCRIHRPATAKGALLRRSRARDKRLLTQITAWSVVSQLEASETQRNGISVMDTRCWVESMKFHVTWHYSRHRNWAATQYDVHLLC